MNRKALLLSILLLCGFAGSGLGGKEVEPTPSCLSATGHFYGQGCSIDSAGVQLPKVEAFIMCTMATTGSYGVGGTCPAVVDDWVRCLALAGPKSCESCNDELARARACQQ